MKLKEFWALVISIVLAQLAGGLGSLFTMPKIPTWYAALVKPPLNPPSWVFGPVWTTLFVFMGVAAFLVWRKHEVATKQRQEALRLYGLQLVLNTIWSFLFFGLQNPGAAFGEIIILWLAIALTIRVFSRISKLAAWLMAPYLAWVTFASYLTLMIWFLN